MDVNIPFIAYGCCTTCFDMLIVDIAQDLLGDDTKGSAKAHDWWTHMVLPDISPIELHQT